MPDADPRDRLRRLAWLATRETAEPIAVALLELDRLAAENARLARLAEALARFPVYRGDSDDRWFVVASWSQWGPYPTEDAAARAVIEHVQKGMADGY